MNPTGDPTTTPRSTPRQRPTKPAGWIYVQHTAYDPTKYVGQSKRPVWNRINEERRTFPWGGDLLPGRDGYTILRRVESLGRPDLDAIALDLAEAEEIARLHPTENANRPNPAVFRARLEAARGGRPVLPPPRPVGSSRRVPVGRRGATPRKSRPFPWRGLLVVLLAVPWAVLVGWFATYWPNPTAPWVVSPMAAIVGPLLTVRWYRRAFGRRPRRRRRRR